MTEWTPAAWQRCAAELLPNYNDESALQAVLRRLAAAEALVRVEDVIDLKEKLGFAAQAKCFVVQAGDCAESFVDAQATVVARKMELLWELQAHLQQGLAKSVIAVGRIAGQYAKPRSAALEFKQDVALPSYQGDLINEYEFHAVARVPRPERMWHGYLAAQLTGKIMQSIMHDEPVANKIFTSHEALLLWYEQALTRQHDGQWFDLSTHFPWIGNRTATLQGAHITYVAGIANPIAIKVGPQMTPVQLQQLVQSLNPLHEPGRLTLIHRLGAAQIALRLPSLIAAVQATGVPVVWMCDPMHGNTVHLPNGYKTRYVQTIQQELKLACAIHAQAGTPLNGIHLEVTAEAVTECIDTQRVKDEHDVATSYTSLVDPRLNRQQAIAVVDYLIQIMTETETLLCHSM